MARGTSLLKRTLRIVGGLVGLLLIALVVTPFLIDWNWLKPRIEAAARDATGYELTITGDLDVGLLPDASVHASGISLSDAAGGKLATLPSASVQLQLWPLLSRRLVVDELRMEQPVLSVTIDRAGRSNWSVGAGGTPAKDRPDTLPVAGIALDGVAIEGGRVSFVDHRSGRRLEIQGLSLEAALHTPVQVSGATPQQLLEHLAGRAEAKLASMVVEPGRVHELRDADVAIEVPEEDGQPKVRAKLTVVKAGGDTVPVALTMDLAPIGQLVQDGPDPVRVQAEIGEITAEVSGKIASPFDDPSATIDVALAMPALTSLEPVIDGDLPALGPVRTSGTLRLGPDKAGVEGLQAQVGRSDIAGSVKLELQGPRPVISGTLTSKTFDLTEVRSAFIPPAPQPPADDKAGSSGEAQSSSGYVIPDTALPLDGLRVVDADLDVHIETLQIEPGVALDAVEVGVHLADGRLKLDPLRTTGSKGSLDGNMLVDAGKEPPVIQVALDFQNVQIGGLLRQMTLFDPRDSIARASIDLKGRGASPRVLVAGLDGHVEISATGGLIDLGSTRLLTSGVSSILRPLLGGGSQAKLRCFLVSYDVTNGVAVSEAQVLDTTAFAVSGVGQIGLETERLNFHFRIRPRSLSLMKLAVPFNVTGTLRHPRATADAAGTVVGTVVGVAKSALTVVDPLAVLRALTAGTDADSGGNPCVAAVQAAKESEGGLVGAAGTVVRDAGRAVGGVARTGEKVVEGVARTGGEVVKGVAKDAGLAIKGIGSLFDHH